MARLNMKKTGAYFLLVATAFFWGVTFVVVKDAINHVGVFVFLSQRFLIAAFILLLIWPFLRPSLNWETILKSSILGTILFLGFAFQTLALLFTSASNTAFLTGLNVVFVPLMSGFFFGQPVAMKTKIGALMAFFGLYLLCTGGAAWQLNWGDFLGFSCAICIAVHIIYTGRFVQTCNVYWLTTIQLLLIGLLSLLVAFFQGKAVFVWVPEIKTALLICSLFATVFAFLVQTTMQRHISPSSTALIFCLEPVFAAVFSFVFLGECLEFMGMIGAGLILSGMILAEFKSYG